MYKNPLLNNSIYDSPSKSQSNNYSNIICYDDEIYFNSNKKKTQNQKQQIITHSPFLTNNSSHLSIITYKKSKQQSKQNNILPSNMFHIPIQTKSKNKKDKTVFTKITERLFQNMNKENYNINFNYYDFINDESLITMQNKTVNNNSNNKIIKQFVARSCSKNKKIVSCSRNKHFSFINTYTKSNRNNVTTNNNSNRSPEKFYSEQKLFLEKKEDNLSLLRNRIRVDEDKTLKEKPTLTPNTVNIAIKKQKCKNVHIRLYKNIDKELNFNICQTYSNENKIPKTPRIISNTAYLRLTSRNNSKNRNSSSKSQHKYSSKLTSNESLGILLDKFLTSFELILINICNINIQNVTYSNIISKGQLFEILLQLHFIKKSTDKKLLETIWNDLYIKTEQNKNQTMSISLLNLLLFLLSILGLIKDFDNKNNIPTYISCRLNGIINLNTVMQFQSKGKTISQINVQYQEMRNNYFNNNFYVSKESTSTNTPEHIPYQPKTKENTVSLYDTYKNSTFAKEKQLQEEREKEIKKELSLCTFKPDLSLTHKQNSSLNNQTRGSITSRLYTDVHNNKKQRPVSNHKIKINNNETVIRKPPKTPTPLNMQMFNINPLQSDRSVQTKYEKLKQTREEQKKKNYYFTRGEPINNRVLYKNSFVNNFKENHESLYLNSDFEIAIDVNKGQNDKSLSKEKAVDIKSFIIKKGENVYVKINEFCQKNGLGNESQKQIISAVKDKKNGIF